MSGFENVGEQPMKTWTRRFLPFLLVGLAALALPVPSAQQGVQPTPAGQVLATGTPESVGMSTERLQRLHQGMQGFVDRHEVGGIVTLIARDGKTVDVNAVGFQNAENRTAMKADTIFRIASMSKPITSVAIMMLHEEGKLLLSDPVSRFIPAFRTMKVSTGANGATEPARRPISIRDLLSHRSGLTYGFLNGGDVGNAYRKNGVSDGLTLTEGTIEQGVEKLAAQPLIAQPGSAWNYSL